MRLVKWLFGLAVLATVLWGGYWFVGSAALDRAVAEVLAAPRSPLSAASHTVRGFPNRFDLTLTEPRVQEGGVAWAAPFVQVFALSYRPHHVVTVFPNEQSVQLGGVDWLVSSASARASAVMEPTANLRLDRASLVATRTALAGGDARHIAEEVRVAGRSQSAQVYEVVAEVQTAFPDPALMDLIDPARIWPRRFDLLRLDGELALRAPLDLGAARNGLPPTAEVALTGARLVGEGLDLRVSGRVVLDAPGGPQGDLVLAVEDWRDLLDRLAEGGLLPPEQRAFVEALVPGLARPDAPGALDIPLRVEAGQVRLGPVVLLDLWGG
jgi:hypothetical protein